MSTLVIFAIVMLTIGVVAAVAAGVLSLILYLEDEKRGKK